FANGRWSQTDWLCKQSDASLALLEAIAGEILDEEWEGICWNIGHYAEQLRLNMDLFDLLGRYDLPATTHGVQALSEAIEDEYDQRRGRLFQTLRAEREKDHDDKIDEMLAQYGLTVPHPRGHPDRMWAANMAIYEHLYDPRS